ncbi:hypothetical protein K502DRAFT_365552 [Neoconidiobolus thromboides FSU 785]|nr:hypothetical protein K502DRAFT_365552 [Neoconidiobolus thromboides FSU 785]
MGLNEMESNDVNSNGVEPNDMNINGFEFGEFDKNETNVQDDMHSDFVSDTRIKLLFPEVDLVPYEMDTMPKIEEYLDFRSYEKLFNYQINVFSEPLDMEGFDFLSLEALEKNNPTSIDWKLQTVPEGLEYFMDQDDLDLIKN